MHHIIQKKQAQNLNIIYRSPLNSKIICIKTIKKKKLKLNGQIVQELSEQFFCCSCIQKYDNIVNPIIQFYDHQLLTFSLLFMLLTLVIFFLVFFFVSIQKGNKKKIVLSHIAQMEESLTFQSEKVLFFCCFCCCFYCLYPRPFCLFLFIFHLKTFISFLFYFACLLLSDGKD